MHELAIAQNIVAICEAGRDGRPVVSVVVGVGEPAAVSAHALSFSFELAAAGTALEGATLTVEPIKATARCASCGVTLTLESYLEQCTCGQSKLTWLSGGELVVRRLELG